MKWPENTNTELYFVEGIEFNKLIEEVKDKWDIETFEDIIIYPERIDVEEEGYDCRGYRDFIVVTREVK